MGRPNMGPVSQPQGMAGNSAIAMVKIHTALKKLQEALPELPMGSPLHIALMKGVESILKHIPPGSDNPQLALMELQQEMRAAAQQQPMAALNRLFPQPGGGGPAMPAQEPASQMAA
jgi:hypothetical protein